MITNKEKREVIKEFISSLNPNLHTEILTDLYIKNLDSENKVAALKYMIDQEKQTSIEPEQLRIQQVTNEVKAYDITKAAKVLRSKGILINKNELYATLREKGYILRSTLGSAYYEPSKEMLKLGYFINDYRKSVNKQGYVANYSVTMITAKGIEFLVDKLKKEKREKIECIY